MVSNHCKEMCKQEDNILQSGNDEASHRWINLKQMEQSKNQKKKQKASKKHMGGGLAKSLKKHFLF